ncbi:MAG: tetratricopeptide repeat protein [Bacteroidota bacterium]
MLITSCCFVKAQNWNDKFNEFSTLYGQEKYAEAITAGRDALRQLEEETGARDTNYANILYYLEYCYFMTEDYTGAAGVAEEHRELRKKLHGTDDLNYLNATYDLAVYKTYVSEYSEAVELMLEVADKIEKQFGKTHMNYISTATQLANIYNYAGSYSKAEELYDELYKTVSDNYPESETYMQMVNTVSVFYVTSGKFEKAEPFYTGALDLMEKYYGKPSKEYLASMNSLGEFYLLAGWYTKSETVYKEFSELCKKFYGAGSADYATALNNLAVTYEKQEKNSEAEELYKKVLKLKAEVYSTESDYYALTLNNFAVLYDNMGEYEKAAELYEQSLGIYEKVHGADSPDFATALSNLASNYSSRGQWGKALEYADRAAGMQKKLYGEKHAGYIGALNNLALLYYEKGDYTKAYNEFLKVISLRKEVQGVEHTEYGISLHNLASLEMEMGKYADSEKHLLEALAIQEKAVGIHHSNYANALNSLANLYFTLGDYRKAELTYLRCERIFRKIYGDLHPEYGTVLSNMGLFYYETGDYEKAGEFMKKARKIIHDSNGRDHPDNIHVYTTLAQICIARGNYPEAEEFMQQISTLAEKNYSHDHPEYGALLNNQAMFYYEMGNYDKAEKLYLEALENREKLYGREHIEYATSVNNLGTLYMAKALYSDDNEEALKYANAAIDNFILAGAIDSMVLGVDHPGYASNLNNLAELYRNLGEYTKAEPLFLRAIELERKNLGENNASLAVSYHNIAIMYSDAGNNEKGLEYALKAYTIKRNVYGDLNASLADVMLTLAIIYEKTGDKSQAADYFNMVIASAYDLVLKNFSFLSEEEKADYLRTIAHYSDLFKSFALKYGNEEPELPGLVYNNELINKGILLRSSGNLRNSILNSGDTALIKIFDEWMGVRQQISKLYSLPEAERTGRLDTLEEKANTLEKTLVVSSGEYREIQEIETAGWKDVAAALGENEAAVEFTQFNRFTDDKQYETVYAALVIKKNSTAPVMTELFTSDQLSDVLETGGENNFRYVSSIYGTEKVPDNRLYQLIWQPMDSILSGISKISYSPTGLLHRIAFSAISRPDGQHLSDRYRLRLLSTTAQLIKKEEGMISGKPDICIFGGCKYDTDSTAKSFWKYLDGTRTEAEAVNRQFTTAGYKSREFTGFDACEDTIKSFTGNNAPVIFHIATHGFFYPDPEETKKRKSRQEEETGLLVTRGRSLGVSNLMLNRNPLMRSGLVLAGGNRVWSSTGIDGEDGVLTAYEVSNMNLRRTQLAVMSACETGLGDIMGSEGVYGLQRAFRIAGVEYMIMSLWQIPDKETVEFMNGFYGRLLKTKDINAAFTETQAEMRKKYDPYYWAAFILIE